MLLIGRLSPEMFTDHVYCFYVFVRSGTLSSSTSSQGFCRDSPVKSLGGGGVNLFWLFKMAGLLNNIPVRMAKKPHYSCQVIN